MGDSPVLDYYRATDHGCRLQRIGETFVEDAYAIGMTKGFPLKDSISALIAKYSSNGYLDILTEKWYGGLPCFKFEADIVQPRPLGGLFVQHFLCSTYSTHTHIISSYFPMFRCCRCRWSVSFVGSWYGIGCYHSDFRALVLQICVANVTTEAEGNGLEES